MRGYLEICNKQGTNVHWLVSSNDAVLVYKKHSDLNPFGSISLKSVQKVESDVSPASSPLSSLDNVVASEDTPQEYVWSFNLAISGTGAAKDQQKSLKLSCLTSEEREGWLEVFGRKLMRERKMSKSTGPPPILKAKPKMPKAKKISLETETVKIVKKEASGISVDFDQIIQEALASRSARSLPEAETSQAKDDLGEPQPETVTEPEETSADRIAEEMERLLLECQTTENEITEQPEIVIMHAQRAPQVYQAVFPYSARTSSEVSLRQGDLVQVEPVDGAGENGAGYFKGKILTTMGSRVKEEGWFPEIVLEKLTS